ncbi:MAG: bactoprenol glucosyl transferase [Schlesneria sp.]|nr:bactoprenol glucosyl transferase [Schlesneria sp.]
MIPCLNEEESLRQEIPDFIEALATDPEYDFEVLFIDDHSTDQTPQILDELCRRFHHVRAIRLGRNCGSHTAYRAGLDYCTGDAVAFTVADLQEGIELIRQSLRLWQAGASVVGTIAIGRDRGGFFNEAGARLFYWLRNRLGNSSREANEAALRVIDRQVVEHCQRHAPRTRNLNSWIFGQPFSTEFVKYTPAQRRFGTSKWTFQKKLRLVIDTLLDTSTIFLTIWLLVGGVLAATSLVTLAAVFGTASRASNSVNFVWFGSLIATIVGCTGLVLLAAGSLGIYIWRILEEMRGGPGYFAEPLGDLPSNSNGSISDRKSTAVTKPRFLKNDASIRDV